MGASLCLEFKVGLKGVESTTNEDFANTLQQEHNDGPPTKNTTIKVSSTLFYYFSTALFTKAITDTIIIPAEEN